MLEVVCDACALLSYQENWSYPQSQNLKLPQWNGSVTCNCCQEVQSIWMSSSWRIVFHETCLCHPPSRQYQERCFTINKSNGVVKQSRHRQLTSPSRVCAVGFMKHTFKAKPRRVVNFRAEGSCCGHSQTRVVLSTSIYLVYHLRHVPCVSCRGSSVENLE